jgi:hypothetical protein
MMEALIEIEKHFNYKNVIYLNGNHELGFMLYTDNSYGLYNYEFDEYVSIYKNGLNRKDEILFEKRKIIYRHLVESPYPFIYLFKLNNQNIIVSHTIQYKNDIPAGVLNNLCKMNLVENIKYLNDLVKHVIINGNEEAKQEMFISLFCKRPCGDFGLSEYLDNIIGSKNDYTKISDYGLDNQTIHNSDIIDEILFKNDKQYKNIHIIGHTPTYTFNEKHIVKYIDNDKINMRLYFIDCNTSNDYKNDNSTMLIISNNKINSLQIISEFYLDNYINEIRNYIK